MEPHKPKNSHPKIWGHDPNPPRFDTNAMYKHSLNFNCKYDDLYSTVSSNLLLGCFTRLLNIKAKSQISNIKKKFHLVYLKRQHLCHHRLAEVALGE